MTISALFRGGCDDVGGVRTLTIWQILTHFHPHWLAQAPGAGLALASHPRPRLPSGLLPVASPRAKRARAMRAEDTAEERTVANKRGEDAARWLEDKLPQMERELAPLVEINSFTENIAGGNQVGRLLLELFRVPGVSARTVESQKFANHLVLSSAGKPGLSPVALIGHLDTVFPPGKFEGYRVDGELRRGPGVLDMKGGLVLIAFALKALHETGGLESVPGVRMAIVSDEEVGSPEGQAVIREAIAGSGSALVFESGRVGDAIVTRRKGTGAVNVAAHGKAAHAGNNHQEGKNAIWALAKFIDAAQGLTDYGRGITVNVGKIQGGQGKNTVPDLAEAFMDMRFCSRADGDELARRFRQAADEATAKVPGTSIDLDVFIARDPMERTDASVRLLTEYGEHAKACGLGCSEAPLVGGGSDASTSSAMGIPSIDGLGPRGKGFHTVEEQIEARSLVWKAQALARFLAARAAE